MIRRRRPADPEADAIRSAFATVATQIDRAQRALLAAIPTSRDPGVPLGQALAGLGRALDAAEAAMPGWRDARLEHEWTSCLDGLRRTRAEAERLRLEPGPLPFEALNARVGDVLHQLDPFADAERRVRRL